jgi:hypothetical protein
MFRENILLQKLPKDAPKKAKTTVAASDDDTAGETDSEIFYSENNENSCDISNILTALDLSESYMNDDYEAGGDD